MKEDGTPDLMLRQRIDAAEAILANNPEITIVASGAQGSDEVISEAKAVEKELIKRGYENKIILEENATSTKENIVYSSNYVNGNVVIVSQQFHLFRIQYLLNKYDLDWDVALADNEYILPLKPFYREPFALIKTIIFD